MWLNTTAKRRKKKKATKYVCTNYAFLDAKE
jgi:hypothetical protein